MKSESFLVSKSLMDVVFCILQANNDFQVLKSFYYAMKKAQWEVDTDTSKN